MFIPPFNLVEVFILVPLEQILPKQRYKHLNDIIMGMLYAPFLSCIAFYESRYMALKQATENGSFEDEDWGDDEVSEERAIDWAKVVHDAIPTMESDMDILTELRERVKKLEGKLSKKN